MGLRLRSEAKTPRRGVSKTYTSADDTTGLSDFIVDDESSTESESAESPQARVRTLHRRLVRGRRRASLESSRTAQSETGEDSELQEGVISGSPPRRLETGSWQVLAESGKSNSGQEKALKKLENRPPSLQVDDSGSGISELSPPHNFSQSTNNSPVKPLRNDRRTKSPHRPSKSQSRLKLPTKPAPRPLTHCENLNPFWNRGGIDKWNDTLPNGEISSPTRNTPDDIGNTWQSKSMKQLEPTPGQAHARARKFFDRTKHEIAKAFLQELDEVITDFKVSQASASTGGIRITWNKKLKTTAGRAIWKRETISPTASASTEYRHHASIELSEKVIDDEDRLLNVIAHEFCHLANFIISGVRNDPHGKEFKMWAAKCSRIFSDRGINVTTKHTYVINYRYIWKCSGCGTELKRHSKSIDPERQQCGSCRSILVQIKPAPRATPAANEYQIFLRENMRKVKSNNPESPQKDIMSMVGKLYQKHKASKFDGSAMRDVMIEVREDELSKSEKRPTAGDEVDLVARQLNFVDLTSP